MLRFLLCQYFETRQATPLVSRLFTQVKLPQTQVTFATCVWGEKCFKTRENSFLGWAGFFFLHRTFNVAAFQFPCSQMQLFHGALWELAERRADYDKIRSHTYCNRCFLLFDTLCQVSGPERGLKMPLWVLLIFKRVEWLLTSPDAVKSPWPHTKTLHCYCWQYCWHTVLKLDNDFFCGGKKSWKKLLDSELI